MGGGDDRKRVGRSFPANSSSSGATEAQGDAYPATLFTGEAGAARLEAERQAYMARLFQDTVGFAAAKIIRRILGLAHNIDFEWIEDTRLRAICEARSLRLARAMLVDAPSFAHDSCRNEGGAGVARLAAGSSVRQGAIRPPWPAISAHRR